MTRINITRNNHRQTIQYILPSDHIKLTQAELVAIDEAAAIPLPIGQNYEGTIHLTCIYMLHYTYTCAVSMHLQYI